MKTETEMHTLYFGETWSEFFDPRVEGGFWELIHYSIKMSIFIALVYLIGWASILAVAQTANNLVVKLSPVCQNEVVQLFNGK